MERVVDIASDGRHLSAQRGFLIVSEDRREVGRVPLDDVAAVIVHAHGVTWSTNLAVALAERGAPLVLCGPNRAPVGVLLPLDGHHGQNARMRAQWEAGRPLAKQLWSRVVVAKLRWQAAVLEAHGKERAALDMLIRKVRSGDPDNIEAQAARRYWPLLMGSDFRRDRDAADINGPLNYGYRLMWIFVMFDLPVTSKAENRAATKFREYLLGEGFEKSQFSVYARFCNGKEQFEAYMRRIEANLPDRGDVHILTFTDRQYENIVRFSGQRRRRQRKNPDQLALF